MFTVPFPGVAPGDTWLTPEFLSSPLPLAGLLKMTFRESLTKRFAGTYLAAPKYAEGNPFYRRHGHWAMAGGWSLPFSPCFLIDQANHDPWNPWNLWSKNGPKYVLQSFPICSMYGIFTNMCLKNHPNVGKYTIHGAYGFVFRGSLTLGQWD